MRFRSHSKGPRMVSSKSLMSKTSRPSGAAKAPRLRTCASPQSWQTNAGIGQHGQVGGHHRHRAAEVAEGRLGHQLVLELDERRHAAAHGALQQLERQASCRALGLSSLCCWRPTCLRRAWPRVRRSSGVAQCMSRNIHSGSRARNTAEPCDLHFFAGSLAASQIASLKARPGSAPGGNPFDPCSRPLVLGPCRSLPRHPTARRPEPRRSRSRWRRSLPMDR